mgnify:CR=1 FL=1
MQRYPNRVLTRRMKRKTYFTKYMLRNGSNFVNRCRKLFSHSKDLSVFTTKRHGLVQVNQFHNSLHLYTRHPSLMLQFF